MLLIANQHTLNIGGARICFTKIRQRYTRICAIAFANRLNQISETIDSRNFEYGNSIQEYINIFLKKNSAAFVEYIRIFSARCSREFQTLREKYWNLSARDALSVWASYAACFIDTGHTYWTLLPAGQSGHKPRAQNILGQKKRKNNTPLLLKSSLIRK